MSMIGNFRSLPDDELRALLENPARVEQLLYGDMFAGTNGEVVSLFGHSPNRRANRTPGRRLTPTSSTKPRTGSTSC
jgi:hypothetical protein